MLLYTSSFSFSSQPAPWFYLSVLSGPVHSRGLGYDGIDISNEIAVGEDERDEIKSFLYNFLSVFFFSFFFSFLFAIGYWSSSR